MPLNMRGKWMAPVSFRIRTVLTLLTLHQGLQNIWSKHIHRSKRCGTSQQTMYKPLCQQSVIRHHRQHYHNMPVGSVSWKGWSTIHIKAARWISIVLLYQFPMWTAVVRFVVRCWQHLTIIPFWTVPQTQTSTMHWHYPTAAASGRQSVASYRQKTGIPKLVQSASLTVRESGHGK